jgi:hypothetical protein
MLIWLNANPIVKEPGKIINVKLTANLIFSNQNWDIKNTIRDIKVSIETK